jgi:ATP-dependent helicase Lhr and Lhr-like helicase
LRCDESCRNRCWKKSVSSIPQAIEQVREEAWPDVRDPDELHDALHTLIAFPVDRLATAYVDDRGNARWKEHFQQLIEHGRAANAVSGDRSYWVAAERAQLFSLLFPDASFDRVIIEIEGTLPSRDDAVLAMVTGWMTHLGPITAEQLGLLLGLPVSEIEKALLRMEASGSILRGKFTDHATRAGAPAPHEVEWCERRLLARIHRLTVATLRKQIEPITPGAVHALAAPLAACRARNASPGRTLHAGNTAAAPRF